MEPDDDEAPPLLVKVEVKEDELEEQPTVKVPLTIVTGKSPSIYVLISNPTRISRGWENDSNELHSKRTAWKEDSCYIEWFADKPPLLKSLLT